MTELAASPLGLYLHIPFCESICSYCNFTRGLYDRALKTRYLAALETEIRRAGDGAAADTIFFGGGTPSLLEPDEVRRMVDACRMSFDLAEDAEVSFEANPETVTVARLQGWRAAGVNRLSFGVQSFEDDELRRLGRRHDAERAKRAIGEAREAGFDNVSADLMLWLPAQTPEACRRSVEALVGLAPDHASLYMLELYPNAPLREEMARAGWSQAPDDDAATMYLDALALTDAGGLEQYEISNVGRPCRHNLKYWQDGEWLGFGCGAHSTRAGRRWRNIAETERYVAAVGRAEPVVAETRTLSADERLGDALFTGLRLVDGIDLAGVQQRYGVDVLDRFGAALEPFRAAGLLVCAEGRLGLTRGGMLLANEVMGAFV